jgi:hypothetical protein
MSNVKQNCQTIVVLLRIRGISGFICGLSSIRFELYYYQCGAELDIKLTVVIMKCSMGNVPSSTLTPIFEDVFLAIHCLCYIVYRIGD